MKNLEERQKREMDALKQEIDEIEVQMIAFRSKTQENMARLKNALIALRDDPETYFKNIDKEE